jgi:hypothetical protein
MAACAAGLPRVSDSPRKTKSELIPMLPLTRRTPCARADPGPARHISINVAVMIRFTAGFSQGHP